MNTREQVHAAHTLDPIPGSSALSAEIVATMREPFAVLDSRLRLVAASQAFFLRFALDPAASMGSSVFDLGAGEWDTPCVRELLEVIAPRRDSVEGYSLEVAGDRAGRARVVVGVRPVREGRNSVTSYLLTFSEPAGDGSPATAEAEDLIGRVRHRSGDLVAALHAGSWEFAAIEGAAREITGYSATELRGLSLAPLLHPRERDGVIASLAGLAAGEPHLRVTFRIRSRDGRYVWIETLCHLWKTDSGSSLVHIVARDVSERKRAEEALRWLARQTKLILDSAADGIVGIDAAGNISFINPVAARALGYRVPELLGRVFRQVLGPEDDEAEDMVAHTLQDGLTRHIPEKKLRCADGDPLLVELSCNASREGGQISGAVVTFRDIGPRKRAEAASLRAEWLAGVGQTTLAVRHEINNPLTTLLAEARLLEMGGNSPEEEREMVAAIAAEARRIGEVIRRLAERQGEPTVRSDGMSWMLDLTG